MQYSNSVYFLAHILCDFVRMVLIFSHTHGAMNKDLFIVQYNFSWLYLAGNGEYLLLVSKTTSKNYTSTYLHAIRIVLTISFIIIIQNISISYVTLEV